MNRQSCGTSRKVNRSRRQQVFPNKSQTATDDTFKSAQPSILNNIENECNHISSWLRLIVHSCVRKLSWPYTHCVRKLSWPYTHCVRKLSWPYTASIIICSRKAVTAAVEAAAAISAEPLKGSAAMCSRKHCVYGQESGWPYTLCKIKHSR